MHREGTNANVGVGVVASQCWQEGTERSVYRNSVWCQMRERAVKPHEVPRELVVQRAPVGWKMESGTECCTMDVLKLGQKDRGWSRSARVVPTKQGQSVFMEKQSLSWLEKDFIPVREK